MNQLDSLLKIFEDKIRLLISREEHPRTYYLLKNDEKGKLTYLFKPVGNETFSTLYDLKNIEVYYNSFNLTNFYIQASNITRDILEKIFNYLAHHEYGHSLFCKSSLAYYNFRERLKNSIFENFDGQMRSHLNNLFWALFRVLKESFADYQVKKNNIFPPKYYFNLYFITFEDLLRKNNVPPNKTMSKLVIEFYRSVLYSSSWFYIFNQWDYLLEKCGENNKTESLKLIFLINNIFEALIRKNLELEGYGHYLIQITLLLNKIDYYNLLFENNLGEDIVKELDDLLASL